MFRLVTLISVLFASNVVFAQKPEADTSSVSHIVDTVAVAANPDTTVVAKAAVAAAATTNVDTAAVTITTHKTADVVTVETAATTTVADTTVQAVVMDVNGLIAEGDELRMQYEFDSSLVYYNQALTETADSLMQVEIKDRILMSENGAAMSQYVYSPRVVAKHLFSLKDFYLYYPLEDKSWRSNPNILDTEPASGGMHEAIYAPDSTWEIYFSAKDADGIRNIYKTEKLDTIWSRPVLLNEHLTSVSDEIYPLLSPDGRTLYFSSRGLHGMGGYDLYMSQWNDSEQDWGSPTNMGFPYSSPADDFLMMNTFDGNHTIFASNRDCSADSVWVYVLEYDNMPIRKAVESSAELRELARLNPQDTVISPKEKSEADIPENVDTRRYMDKMTEVRHLRDSIAFYEALLEKERHTYAFSSDPDQMAALTVSILDNEKRLPVLRDSLERASSHLQKIEMEFLFSGVVINPDVLLAQADKEVVGEATSFTFSKNSMGDSLQLNMLPPPVEFDYSFKVLDEAVFAEDNTIPSKGVIYQIQIMGGVSKRSEKHLKGLSPVFEFPMGSSYRYRVGLFSTYKDVLSNLNTVKRLGFRTAFIVAYIDGVETTVQKARRKEAELEEQQLFYQIHIVPSDGKLDETLSSGISQLSAGKDIARIEDKDGRIVYVVGPFDEKSKVNEMVEFIKAMGEDDVTEHIIKTK